jgi:hypothetical protein
MEATSPHFAGLICLMNPPMSWVGDWFKFSSRVPGCYCVDVDGDFEIEPEEEEVDEEQEEAY